MRILVFFQITALLLASTVRGNCADSDHGLAPEQQRASADVPQFATIARSPNFDAKQLAYFLLNPHPKMPDLPLSRAATDDITAYIATLK